MAFLCRRYGSPRVHQVRRPLARNRTTEVTLRALKRAIALRDPKPEPHPVECILLEVADNEPHRVNVDFQTEDKQRKLTFLVTRQ